MYDTSRPHNCQAGCITVWHPENLDVGAMLKRYRQRVGEGVLWIGHCIFVGLADDARCRDTGRVPLMSQYLYKIVGRHHIDAVRQAAFRAGYVEHDASYRAGVRSQAYWILPPYDRAPLVRREIANPGLCHNIRQWRTARCRKMRTKIERQETPIIPAVCRFLSRNLERIRIDENIDYGKDFHPAHQVAVARIQDREFWLIADDYGRIHTNITNLKRELRQCLSVDAERLANIDISESQPLFVGLAIARDNTNAQASRERQRKGEGETGGPGRPSLMFDSIMFDKNTLFEGELDRRRLPSDLRRYLELCERRALYQTLAETLGVDRETAKHQIMVVFYGRPGLRNAASSFLDEHFPTVMRSMREMKRPDYCRLAHFAQRIESRYMYWQVVPRIMELRPDLFVSTIHDSILTTAGNADFVQYIMLDEFARLGLSPQVKVELCCKTH
jgi:hypothetical protein